MFDLENIFVTKKEKQDTSLNVYTGRAVYSIQRSIVPNILSQYILVPEICFMRLEELLHAAPKHDYSVFIPIWGVRGQGKTTTMLWLLYEYYGDWNVALDHFVQTLPEFMHLTKQKQPVVGWDDMVVHFGKWTKTFKKSSREFFEYLEAIRTRVNFFMATMVLPSGLPLAIRSKYNGEILMSRRGLGVYESYHWQLDVYKAGEAYFKKYYVGTIVIEYPLPAKVQKIIDENRDILLKSKELQINTILEEEAKEIIKGSKERKEMFLNLLERADLPELLDYSELNEREKAYASEMVLYGFLERADSDTSKGRILFKPSEQGSKILNEMTKIELS